MGVGGQRHVAAAITPGKTRYALCRRLGGSQGRSGRVRKISPHRDSIPETSSPSESLYRLSYHSPQSARYCCLIFTKFGVSLQILVKVPNIKFHEKSNQLESRCYMWRDRQMDRYGEANRRFPLFMRKRLKVIVLKWNATLNVHN
jgi:hypothetical protein